MAAPVQIRLNLGGEGEERDVINQQPEWIAEPRHGRQASRGLTPLIASGEAFLFCRNTELPLPDGSVDHVLTNNVPLDVSTWLGPGVQSSEVKRVLRSGGQWQHNGVVVYTKP